MTDREKVIKGLKSLYERLVDAAKRDKIAMLDAIIVSDALALLKAQEPRVMTLEEVRQAEINSEPLWCEFIDCAFGSWRMGWILKTQSRREVQHVIENHFERAIVWESEYGIGWRCWTTRPTDAQREATAWHST